MSKYAGRNHRLLQKTRDIVRHYPLHLVYHLLVQLLEGRDVVHLGENPAVVFNVGKVTDWKVVATGACQKFTLQLVQKSLLLFGLSHQIGHLFSQVVDDIRMYLNLSCPLNQLVDAANHCILWQRQHFANQISFFFPEQPSIMDQKLILSQKEDDVLKVHITQRWFS